MLVGSVLLKDLTVISMINDVKGLLIFLADNTDHEDYDQAVNVIAQLLMGHKFGYDEGIDYADISLFKAEARNMYKKKVVLKALKKGPTKLEIVHGGKDKVDQ